MATTESVDRRAIILTLIRKGGRACAADIANELPQPIAVSELVPVVEALADEGVIERVSEDSGRKYDETQTLYALKS
ncbi:MAG TPA: hypothetical protein VNA69_14115 [Thermoanaerobaculia bacterium]|nr:hypothetical protein [Thermoanaerobaculia bacterium]